MSMFDTPNISVGAKTNEENLQATKGYLNELAATLNIKFNELEERIETLEAIINNLEGEN